MTGEEFEAQLTSALASVEIHIDDWPGTRSLGRDMAYDLSPRVIAAIEAAASGAARGLRAHGSFNMGYDVYPDVLKALRGKT